MTVALRVPREVYTDRAGFIWLTSVARTIRPLYANTIEIDARRTIFFDGNLCAAFGALLADAKANGNTIVFGEVQGDVLKKGFGRNDFGLEFGFPKFADEYDTSIQYRQFDRDDSLGFNRYLDQELMSKDIPLPSSSVVRGLFRHNIAEVFANCTMHSFTNKGIFCCGQHFPHKGWMNYTLVDLGIGFRRSVQTKTQQQWTASDAIQWATEGKNTGRLTGAGGLGLKRLCRFIQDNQGQLHILSEDGFWELKEGKASREMLASAFPGTVVNLQINTSLDAFKRVEAAQGQQEWDDQVLSLGEEFF